MALDLQRAAQRRMRIMVIVLIGVVVLLAGLLVGVLTTGGGDGDQAQGGHESPSASSTPDARETEPGHQPTQTAPAGDADDFVAPEEYVQLPPAKKELEGLPVGYPQTPEGAVAMVAASTRTGWSWDVDQVERGIRAYSSAAERADLLTVSGDAAKGVRKYVGVPETGTVPEGASVNAWAIGVQWEEMSATRVRVTLLVRLTFTAGAGEASKTHLIPSVVDAVWESGDWKAVSVPVEVAQDTPKPADLGTREFAGAGWIAIQEGERR